MIDTDPKEGECGVCKLHQRMNSQRKHVMMCSICRIQVATGILHKLCDEVETAGDCIYDCLLTEQQGAIRGDHLINPKQ